MPTESTVYRALLAMPPEISEERGAAKDVLLNWNAATGRQQRIHLEPVDADHLNIDRSDLTEEIDILVGAFWTTAGNETAGETDFADVVNRLAIDGGLPALIGFCEDDLPQNQVDMEEYNRLQAFREKCHDIGYFTYVTEREYETQLNNALTRTMNRVLSADSDSRASDDHEGPSEYDPEVDYERLELSAEMHQAQDNQNIDRVVERLQEAGIEQPYSVLDVGCGYGTVTRSRFGHDERFEVLAIDDSKEVLQIAKDEYSANNIEYRWLDANDVGKADLGSFDLVFASYLFHHVENQESILSLLWNRVRDGGVLMVRSCDDGQYLHYPPNENMDWIIDTTDDIAGSSDRTHGRRLPTQMKRLSPAPADVWLDMKNYHTVGRDSSERRDYWTVFHSNRLHYAEVRAEQDDATRREKQRYQDMAERMTELKDKITGNEHILDAKSVPVAVAVK